MSTPVSDPELLSALNGEAPVITDAVLDAVRHVESGGNNRAVSKAGAMGPYQFMPATAKRFGLKDPFDEPTAREAARTYLTFLHDKFGNLDDALRGYNAGEGTVQKVKAGKREYKPETLAYAEKVNNAMGTQQPQQSEPTAINDPALLALLNGEQQSALPKAVQKPKKDISREAAEMALADMSLLEQGVVGIGKSFADVGRTLGLMDDDSKEADAALTDTTAGMLGNIGGDIALTALPGGAVFKGAMRVPQLMNATSRLGRTAAMATAGGAAGGVSEAMLNRDPVTGAMLGAVGAPVIAGAGKLLNKGVEYAQRTYHGGEGGAVEQLRSIFARDLPGVEARLRSTRAIVPGEQVTAGHAANADFPELAALEAGARGRPNNGAFTRADEASEAARLRVLEDIEAPGARPIDPATGREMDSTVEALRRATTAPGYQQAMSHQVPLTDPLRAVLKSPEVAPMLRNALGELRQETANAAANRTRAPAAGRAVPGQGQVSYSIQQLQRVVRELDDAIAKEPSYALTSARRAISTAMGNASPLFRQTNQTFGIMSAPQNRADVARVLAQALRSPGGAGERIVPFGSAMRNQHATVNKADLSRRGQSIDEVFAPQQMGDGVGSYTDITGPMQLRGIRDVQRSLEREKMIAGLPKGVETVPKYLSPAEELEKKMPNTLTRWMSLLRGASKVLGRRTDAQVRRIIDDAMTDPNRLADLIAQLPPTERNEFVNVARNYMKNGDVLGVASASAAPQLSKTE